MHPTCENHINQSQQRSMKMCIKEEIKDYITFIV